MLSDVLQNCWLEEAALVADSMQLMELFWHYTANQDTSYNYDICISELTAIVDAP